MNEVRTLFENFWICKDSDKETYYRVKRDIPNFQKFIREQLGWKLVHTESLLKLEKIPAHAESFMGIEEFTDLKDYCILCVLLMYLEDKAEGEQFLLSELIDYVETQLKTYMEVDWTSFTQRKSLVRVLQFMEKLQMLRVYEGKSEGFSVQAGQEVLYENTGYSKYFATSFPVDISGYTSWEDFEKSDFEEFEESRGTARINRVYRQLAVCPALYWDKNDDADDCYGAVHPRDAMLPEVVLLVCAEIQKGMEAGKIQKTENECIVMENTVFTDLLQSCREKWRKGWSKEYREMDEKKFIDTVYLYMSHWMLLKKEGTNVILFPATGRQTGYYPGDFVEKQ